MFTAFLALVSMKMAAIDSAKSFASLVGTSLKKDHLNSVSKQQRMLGLRSSRAQNTNKHKRVFLCEEKAESVR